MFCNIYKNKQCRTLTSPSSFVKNLFTKQDKTAHFRQVHYLNNCIVAEMFSKVVKKIQYNCLWTDRKHKNIIYYIVCHLYRCIGWYVYPAMTFVLVIDGFHRQYTGQIELVESWKTQIRYDCVTDLFSFRLLSFCSRRRWASQPASKRVACLNSFQPINEHSQCCENDQDAFIWLT